MLPPISDVLCNRLFLFCHFSKTPFSAKCVNLKNRRIRKGWVLAIKVAKKYGYNLSVFLSDMDGHVRNLAMKSLKNLSFLGSYIPKYRVDISDDLESAIIYNPNSEDHLYIEYDKADEFSPYMLSFSFQHVHLTDEESAKEWIDSILSEDVFSIEYFCGEDRRYGGQISA